MKTLIRKPIVICFILALSTIILSLIIVPILITLFVDNPTSAMLLGQIIGFAIPILIVLYITSSKEKSLFIDNNDFKKFSKFALLKILINSILIFGLTLFFNISLELILAKTNLIPIKSISKFDFFEFLRMIIFYAIIPAIIEEVYYKGVLGKVSLSKIELYVITVLLFALSHQGILNVASAFLFGSIMYFRYLKDQNISKLIIIHLVYNVLAIIFANYVMLPFEFSSLINDSSYIIKLPGIIFITIAIALGFGLSYYLFNLSKNEINKLELKNIEQSSKVHYIFLGLMILIFFIYFLINNVITFI